MPKTKVIYACQHCGAQYPKWQGQCAECGKWNCLLEETDVKSIEHPRVKGFAGSESKLTPLNEITVQNQTRLATGLAEFDYVLGGGLVSDSAVLIGGDPGIGKSTILIQVLCQIAKHAKALYVTGEESLQQIALRSQRLGLPQDALTLLAETRVEKIMATAQSFKPQIMVIDSIQTMYTDLVQSAPGSVSQVRECAAQLVRFAKQTGTAILLVGHVTKEGAIAGPRVLEHMVDAVLYFEGRNDSRYRVIRAVKNRFGAVNEIGVFAMTDRGLKEVTNPSAIFLSQEQKQAPGSSVLVAWEGSRPLLVEVQALVDESHISNPRRVTVGLEHNRLAMLLAVLHRHASVATYDQDVFASVVGGLRVHETAADLSIICSIVSSLKNKTLSSEMVVFGEVGLSGEIRPVPSGQERLKEAAKHGFKQAIIPKANLPKQTSDNIQVNGISHLSELFKYI